MAALSTKNRVGLSRMLLEKHLGSATAAANAGTGPQSSSGSGLFNILSGSPTNKGSAGQPDSSATAKKKKRSALGAPTNIGTKRLLGGP